MNSYDKKILIVDDEIDVRNYLKSVLENYGFIVETAVDGLDALDKINHFKPDLISLDLVMPRHSGIKFYHDLQKNKEFKNIPIIIVTGHARDEIGKMDFEQMIMLGPGIYLEKPVKPENYILKICQLLNIEPPEEVKNYKPILKEELEEKLAEKLKNADLETLKKALDFVEKNKGGKND